MKDVDSSINTPEEDFSESDWERLEGILESFSDAWKHSPLPNIADFVPDGEKRFRYLALVELIKIDMERRGQRANDWMPLECYQRAWPELCVQEQMPTDLIYEEYLIRQSMGSPGLVDFESRFPTGIQALSRLIKSDTSRSTSLLQKRPLIQFSPGDQVDDFDLLMQLGVGAFATVFLARQNSMQRLVAVKISANQGFEPQTLAQLDHPHIVRVFDQRLVDKHQVRLLYMQYVPGASLSELLKELKAHDPAQPETGRRLVDAIDVCLQNRGESIPINSENRRHLNSSDWPTVVSHLGKQIASALAYAHSRHVLHRDLKPANVLLDADCHVKLVDFNISFCSKLDGVTAANFFGGSLSYMSPEQLEASSPYHDRQPGELDGQSDLYSLGVLLYEMLVGQRPFVDSFTDNNWSEALKTMVAHRRSGLSIQAGKRLGHTPALLATAIRRSLASEPQQRGSIASLIRQLDWAGQPGSEWLLGATCEDAWSFADRFSIVLVCAIAIVINLAAALFIMTYNLMESTPQSSHQFFQTVVGFVNAGAFTLGGWGIIWLILPVDAALRELRLKQDLTPDQLRLVTVRNWNLGHYIAILCASEWAIAGFLYPVILTVAGAPMNPNGWFDFINSHAIAGLLAGAFLFWTITYWSLQAWHPKFMMASLANKPVEWESQLDRMKRRISVYQIIAVAMPLLAIAWLVWWGRARNVFAIGAVTLIALGGLGILSWTQRRIQKLIQVIQALNSCSRL